uniref:BPTI/Kunitz inhibitor domain-containing protein n=1 Tax=Drosophila melanogaster TaxID=7227 RepID=M9PCI3_DROME|nr:uncharacterized protein Dmel_CG43703 [Drosophila melanogaster]AGB92545.1 uncharacterized protein Dmel_CG43703 [Drosophila melanogaster]|eukprot:NP_001260009.1 uncharacterized protein Dmel_CG43703 [Drosophila melanogaster]
MKIYLFILSLALRLLNVLALKDPICGLKPRVNRCISAKESLVLYGYSESRNICYKIKNPCQTLVRRFATKEICQKLCQEELAEV